MNAADRALKSAYDAFSAAWKEGSLGLNLSGEEFRALKELPDSIGELKQLQTLILDRTQIRDLRPLAGLSDLTTFSLQSTQVRDISPLSGLSELRLIVLNASAVSDVKPLAGLFKLGRLGLSHTQVTDLRPLRSLNRLVEDPTDFGLSFKGSAAAKADPHIAKIASITLPRERARILFEYLDTWEQPSAPSDTPPPDEIFPVEVLDDRLEVAASSATAAEQEEALKRSMHEALKDLADRLAKAAGNQFPQLAEAARRLEGLLDCPFDELDLPRLYVGLRPILNAVKAGAEDELAFTDQVADLLDQAELSGLGLTRDNPDVETLIKRAGRQREHPDPEEDRVAQDAMSHAVASNIDAIGDQLRDLQSQLIERGDPEAVEAKKAINRNILLQIGVVGGSIGGAVVGTAATDIAQGVLGPAILEFVAMHSGTLANAALIHGREFAEWFGKALSKLLSNR